MTSDSRLVKLELMVPEPPWNCGWLPLSLVRYIFVDFFLSVCLSVYVSGRPVSTMSFYILFRMSVCVMSVLVAYLITYLGMLLYVCVTIGRTFSLDFWATVDQVLLFTFSLCCPWLHFLSLTNISSTFARSFKYSEGHKSKN